MVEKPDLGASRVRRTLRTARQEELRRGLMLAVQKAVGTYASRHEGVALVDVIVALGMAAAADTLSTVDIPMSNADAIARGLLMMSFEDALQRERSGVGVPHRSELRR